MSYSSSNPPNLVLSGFNASSLSIWSYESADPSTDVDADGYITNGDALGMKVSDLVLVTETDQTPPIITTHSVVSVTAGGAVDLSDLGATLATADGD